MRDEFHDAATSHKTRRSALQSLLGATATSLSLLVPGAAVQASGVTGDPMLAESSDELREHLQRCLGGPWPDFGPLQDRVERKIGRAHV